MNKSLLLLFFAFSSFQLFSQTILISEINYKSEFSRNAGDWFELHNYGSSAVDISNWKIKDSSPTTIAYTVPSGTSIAANGYLVFYNDLVKFNSEHSTVSNKIGPLGFGLSKSGETIIINNALGVFVDSVNYKDTLDWPKAADGFGTTLEYDSPSNPSFQSQGSHWFDGCIGGSPGVANFPCTYQIIFSEINYNSDSLNDQGEFLELYNKTTANINLTGYSLRDGRDTITNVWYFPSGTMLNASSRLVLSNDLVALNSKHGTISNALGGLPFNFSNTGEALRLYNGSGKLIHVVRYNDKSPWPVGDVDGGGYTLEANISAANFNKGTSWFKGCLLGSPGEAYVTPCETNIEEQSYFDTNIFPNPSQDFIYLNTIATNAKIMDISGKVILEQKIETFSKIDCSGWTKGVYFIQLSDNDLIENHKIIIQ